MWTDRPVLPKKSWRSGPLMFLLPARCQKLRESQKYMATSVTTDRRTRWTSPASRSQVSHGTNPSGHRSVCPIRASTAVPLPRRPPGRAWQTAIDALDLRREPLLIAYHAVHYCAPLHPTTRLKPSAWIGPRWPFALAAAISLSPCWWIRVG